MSLDHLVLRHECKLVDCTKSNCYCSLAFASITHTVAKASVA